ncbi:tRNA (adenosine(37)-N6)-threonylcarbamoyltransferase complex dimerization subunit type 1 TsaB [Halocynthiibacter sp. C4]|uniref:tRNA (adenosine(37)-N6)-threonylcarbamoyltransferase complex dimerization subunit type 1 TsaB n=1 Tax=Halocynthiibacter sp. C4 TaxID=2992758 RepID=UPI00237BD274|nr:tRNA (adenosine(37)-N6)-threonylcarbamoyltransferase complex dimerization subunit type 1 TsaB [Halocynthiibacter sp. C4]MDE0590360.1 tRNA (adenosine(37)-N6)-threonylcarbamoyltransferase complex dimerization subunit type 1 TsaB [Halocynthiibacter sp. C4]
MPPKPLVLGFDTSAAHCAAALLAGNEVLGETLVPMKKGQAESLLPILEDLLATHDVSWADLAAIGVGTGPGNFTGIRVSVSAARGLALALGIPAVGVTTLEAQTEGFEKPVFSAIEARRDHVYLQEIGTASDVLQPLVTDVNAITREQTVIGAEHLSFTAPKLQIAEAIARIAARRFESQPSDMRPAPFYVRKADAAPAKDAPPVLLD